VRVNIDSSFPDYNLLVYQYFEYPTNLIRYCVDITCIMKLPSNHACFVTTGAIENVHFDVGFHRDIFPFRSICIEAMTTTDRRARTYFVGTWYLKITTDGKVEIRNLLSITRGQLTIVR